MLDHTSVGIPAPREMLRAAFRHKRKMGLFVVLTMLLAAAVICFYPRKYLSEAKLFVRVGRESVTLDPTATTGTTVGVYESRENEINSVVEIVQSRTVVEKTVDALGPLAILERGKSIRRTPAATDDKLNMAAAVRKIERALSVSAQRNSSVITIRYYGSTPEAAQRVADQLLQTCIAEHLRINRTPGSREFFHQQTKLKSEQWHEAAARLRDAKNELGLVSVESQRQFLHAEIDRLDEQLVKARTEQVAAETRIAQLKQIVEQLPERIVTQLQDGHPNVALDSMRTSLYELELTERALVAKFTDEHPQLVAVRDQVDQARKILEGQEAATTRSTTDTNPARENLQQDLLLEQAEGEALAAKVARLTSDLARAHEKVKQLNDNEARIARLEQDARLAEKNYLAYAENLEQARIDTALQEDHISNLNVVQQASFEPRPASPNRKIVIALAIVIALLGSIGVVIVSEQTDGSLRSADDVQRQLDLPVFVSLPRTVRHPFAASQN